MRNKVYHSWYEFLKEMFPKRYEEILKEDNKKEKDLV